MADVENRYNEMISLLKEKGYRMTPQRMALVKLIAVSKGHPNAAMLFNKIKEKYPSTSPATVYKTIYLLKEMGQVLEIDMHEDSHYDGNKPFPHPHLICIQCGRIDDGELEIEPSQLEKIERRSGYQIVRQQLSFYGLCPDCREPS